MGDSHPPFPFCRQLQMSCSTIVLFAIIQYLFLTIIFHWPYDYPLSGVYIYIYDHKTFITLTTYKFQNWTVVRHCFMWNQSHLSEWFADVILELPPSAEGGIVTVTRSLPLMLERDHCLQCPSQPLPQLLSSKIIKLCKVGKNPSDDVNRNTYFQFLQEKQMN